MGTATTNDEVTSWWFHMPGNRDFTSFTLLSSDFPVPVFHDIQTNGLANNIGIFGIDIWRDPTAPGSVFTATYEVAFSDTTNPIPEPGTYALMLAGLAGLAGVASRRRKGR
jgi:hypothetical protein